MASLLTLLTNDFSILRSLKLLGGLSIVPVPLHIARVEDFVSLGLRFVVPVSNLSDVLGVHGFAVLRVTFLQERSFAKLLLVLDVLHANPLLRSAARHVVLVELPLSNLHHLKLFVEFRISLVSCLYNALTSFLKRLERTSLDLLLLTSNLKLALLSLFRRLLSLVSLAEYVAIDDSWVSVLALLLLLSSLCLLILDLGGKSLNHLLS